MQEIQVSGEMVGRFSFGCIILPDGVGDDCGGSENPEMCHEVGVIWTWP